nr:Chain CCC, mutant human collagen type II,259-273 [Homo sapiens]
AGFAGEQGPAGEP